MNIKKGKFTKPRGSAAQERARLEADFKRMTQSAGGRPDREPAGAQEPEARRKKRLKITAISVAAVLAVVVLRNYGNFARAPFDKLSVVLSTVGLVCVLYGLSTFASSDNMAVTAGLIAAGLVLCALYVRRQLTLPEPMLQVGILRTRKYATAVVIIVIVQAVPAAAYHILIQFAGSQGALHLPMLFKQGDLRSYILPIFSLAIGNIAYYAMWLRRYMVDESNKDYIRLARAKGLPSGAISRRHMFRNAMVPLIQYIPNSILFTLMGSLYVESLYSIPGMGGLLVTVIKRQEKSMVVALVLIYAAISILGLLFGDILMAILDPRISFTKKEGAR